MKRKTLFVIGVFMLVSPVVGIFLISPLIAGCGWKVMLVWAGFLVYMVSAIVLTAVGSDQDKEGG